MSDTSPCQSISGQDWHVWAVCVWYPKIYTQDLLSKEDMHVRRPSRQVWEALLCLSLWHTPLKHTQPPCPCCRFLTTGNVSSAPEYTGCCWSCCETPALVRGLSCRTKPCHLRPDTVHVIIIHPNEHVRAAAADLSSEQKKNTSKHYQLSRKTGTIRKITHF